VRHSRAPDYCARIAREHRAPRSNICACAGTSEPWRLALRCMIISAINPPSHAAVAAALALLLLQVTWELLSFCLAFRPSSLPLPPPSVWPCTSLCTPFLPPPSVYLAISLSYLSFLNTVPNHSAEPVPSTRFIFHSFFVLDHHPVTSACSDACGYQNLQITILPFTLTPAYRYASNITFPGSRITLWQHRGIRATPARSMRLAA
jgi:hypothetical protein